MKGQKHLTIVIKLGMEVYGIAPVSADTSF